MVDLCVVCGDIIPEGRQVCRNCEMRIMYGVPREKQGSPKKERKPKKFFRDFSGGFKGDGI